MNSGAEPLRRRLVMAAAFTTASARAYAQRTGATPEWGLRQLMEALRQVRSSTARFVETRTYRMLNQTVSSSGRLIYVAPDRLQKETVEPVPARLTVNGDRLTIERQGEPTRDISLRDHSEIGALVESIRATLAGDLPALTRNFTTAFEGDANAWTLTLAPMDPRLRQLVTTIRIKGARAAMVEVETTEADGDRTDMAIRPDQK
jgi:outer membrane lipoprotein-sorting protein